MNGAFSNTNGGAVFVNGLGGDGGASVSVAGNFTNDGTSGATMVPSKMAARSNITGAGNGFTNQNSAQLLVNSLGTVNVAGNFTNASSAQLVLQTGGALGFLGTL